jgi:single-stranded-DNA-specific exonuclease
MKKTIKRRFAPPGMSSELPDHLHPVLRRVLVHRQIVSAASLDYSLKNLLPFHLLKNIEQAVTLLYEMLSQQARILIVADFDADGATSCALAVKALRQMGAQSVDFLVPNREEHGYGLTPTIVELALAKSFNPNLIITVDNGISSVTGVQAAHQRGIKVLITDHHASPPKCPKAEAIINPNQPDDLFPSKHLAGVGVIFYVMMALRAYLRSCGWFTARGIPEPNLADLLDLVALGTVADIVPLDYNNQILVEQGLRRIRAGQCCLGIRALTFMAGRDLSTLTTSDLGFALGPRLNAAGRMDDMSHGIACLLSDNEAGAVERASLLDSFNTERRQVEAAVLQEATQLLDTLIVTPSAMLPVGLCLFAEHWHAGVVGIVAARIKEQLHRPVIIFCRDKHDMMRGSGRSVVGVHIRDVIETIAIQNPDWITHFGGHAMAAGLTLRPEFFDLFKNAFNQEVAQQLPVEQLEGIIFSDGFLEESDFNLLLAEQLRTLPWGQGFPEPIFDGEFELLGKRVLKEKHLKMQVKLGYTTLEVVAFNTPDTDWSPAQKQLQMAYKLEVNTFRGIKQLQLKAEYINVL